MIILRGYSITGQKIFEEHFASGDQESDTISAEVKCIGLRKLLPEGKVTGRQSLRWEPDGVPRAAD